MNLPQAIYLWTVLAASVTGAALGLYAWRQRDVPGALPYAGVCLLLEVWLVAGAWQITSRSQLAMLIAQQIQYTVYAWVPLVCLVLALQITGHSACLTRLRLAWFLLEPLVAMALGWSNDWHRLVWSNRYVVAAGDMSVIVVTMGPWLWVHAVYSFSVLFAAMLLLSRTLTQSSRIQRHQMAVLLTSMMLPIAWHLWYIFGARQQSGNDLTPIVYCMAGLLMGWGLFRYRLFDLVPVARNLVIERIPSGVVVLDARGRVVDCNVAAYQIFQFRTPRCLGLPASEALGAWPDLLELSRSGTSACRAYVAGTGDDRRYFEAHVSPITDHLDRTVGTVVVLHDITEREHATTQLLRQQTAMAVLRERDWLAREVHDNLAQVLSYVNVQAQAVRHLLSQGQTGVAGEHLARLISVAQAAHVDAREYIADVKAAGTLERGFLPTLEEYAKRFSETFGIPVAIATPRRLPSHVLDPAGEVQLLRIIQEALTNTRKHACADRASISVTTDEDWAQVVIEDHGRGFDPTMLSADGESHGMRSMRERAVLLGGSLDVFSQPGQGTRVVVRAPVTR